MKRDCGKALQSDIAGSRTSGAMSYGGVARGRMLLLYILHVCADEDMIPIYRYDYNETLQVYSYSITKNCQ